MFIGVSKIRWTLGVLTAVIILCTVAASVVLAEEQSARQQAMQMQGKQFIDIAAEQYNRGLNEDAKATVRKAQAYKDYLADADKNRLDELVKSLGLQAGSVQSTEPVVENIAAELLTDARALAAQGRLEDAKARYLQAKQSGRLSAAEIAAVDAELAALGYSAPAQPAPAVPSVQSQVNEQYITLVPVDDNTTTNTNEVNTVPSVTMPAETQTQPQTAPTDTQVKENYIETVKQKQRIQQSYTKAVVNEAVAKAKEYSDKEDFARAKEEIFRASAVVEKNKMLLGEEDYKQYTATLQQLTTDINARQAEIEKKKSEEAKAEAQAAQERL